ncbi:MAG TPA: hypothetical protein VKU02_22610 [Gemmataceae bacterium]|nr:hypothetical protein [Gemmataceae bacterium]
MTSPADRPRSSSLDRRTRQQLDELDALMQRMLALPVELPETQSPSEITPESMSIPPATLSEAVPDVPTSPSEPTIPDPVGLPAVIAHKPSPRAAAAGLPAALENMENWGSSSRSHLAAASPFASLESPRPVEAKSASFRPAETVHRPRIGWPLYPLVWINRAFDFATGWLGPLGRWLRGPAGRGLLGWVGLLLLAAALAWLAWDGLGWTW